MNRAIGTCGTCGGPVTLPDVWMGVCPPTPSCQKCGAVPAQPYGPMIPMQPRPSYYGQERINIPARTYPPMARGPVQYLCATITDIPLRKAVGGPSFHVSGTTTAGFGSPHDSVG